MGWARKELGIELNPFRVAESAMRKFGDVVQAIMNNPIPAILQIGGAMIGIPPYVTSAAITAVQGGDLKDIAKSAAVAYVTSDFLQNTQIGADIRNYTANVWSGDVTDFMIENFDISMDQAVNVAKISSAALTGAVSGGIRATLLGDSVGTGIASGFSSGLVYSSVDSYFDDLNKDPNWGLGPKTLNIIKGATSTGLNTIISGKGDPAQAIGNYIAYSTLKLGASEFKQTLQRAYDEHTGKTDEARNAQQAYLTVKAEYDAEVRRHDDLANEIRMQYQNYEADYARYTKIQSDLTRLKQDYDGASRSVNSLVYSYDMAVQRYNAGVDNDINDIIEAKETLDRLLPQYEEVAARSSQYFINLRDATNTQAVLGRLEETKNTIAIKSDDLKAIKAKIETPENGNLAERLKFAAENYDKKYNLYKTSEEGVQKAAEVYNKTAAEIASRDFTIDAINSGALAVTEVAEDGSYRLDNGMTVKDGKFYQNGNPLFMDAAGVSQNNLEMKLPDGQIVRYGMNAGRQMSPTDVQNAFIRDYGVELSAAEARQFVGTGYGMYDVHKFEDFAKKKVNEAYKLIAGKDATAQQQQQFIKVPNSQNAAIQAAVVEKEPEIANNQAAIDARNRVATEVLQGYRDQGMTPEQITERIDSGLAVDDLNEILETQKREVDNKIQKAQQLSQNQNSPEYKEAYRQALDAMAEYGGYGVNKEADGSYYYDNIGKIDPETLVPVTRSRFWTDPVTGKLHIHLVGVGSNDELIPAKDVSALWAIGKSGNPPSKGGEAVLGDGSGVQSGMPGPTLIAIDDGSGDKNAKMFDVGNGFALIAYSDGTRKLVKTDGTVFWMDTENADNAVKNLPVVTTPTLAINGGKEEVNVGEKAIGEFYSILTDPTLAEKLYPEKPTQQTPVTPPTVTPEAPSVVTPEVPVTPPVTPVTPPSVPETPVTPPVVPEAPVTPPVTPPVVPETPVTPPVVPEAPVTPPVTTPADPALQQLRNDVTAQIAAAQAQGKTELEAVQQAVDSVAANLGTTKEALLAQLGTTEAQLRSEVTTQVGGVENRLTAAIAAAQQAGQTGDAALQAGIAQVATDLGTTKEQLLAQVGKTEEQLRADMQAQVGGVESRLTAAIDAAKQSGMQGDAALQAGINQVATELGTTKEQLLSQIGKTEQQLRADVTGQISGVETRLRDAITAAQQSGQTGDAALQAGINKVASDLGTTKDQLLAQVGKTEEQLRSDMQAQVSGVETRLTDAIEQARQSGLEGDAALQAGINKVASDLNTTKDIVLEQVGKTEQQLRTDLAAQLGGVQQQIGQVQTNLTKAIADAKAAGATDVQAVRDALATVSTSLGTTQEALLQQLGKSEADLRAEFRAGQQSTQEQIENLGSTFMQQYDALNAAQKSQFDALVEQGSNLRSAMDLVQTQTQEQLQNVETRLRDAMAANEAAGMSRDEAATKAIQDVATSVGTTKNELLAQVGKTEDVLRSELATGLAQTQEQIRSELQTQYDQLTAAQKAQFDAMVEQGANLRTAMDLVRSEAQAAQEQTQQQIAQLDANTQTKFNQLSEAQQQQALDLAKASGDLTTAINNVAAETATQITGVETRLREAMEANEAAGLSRDEAANKAIQDVATSVGTSKEQLLSQLGKTEQTLRGELTAGLAGVQTGLETQIAGVQKNLNDAIAANEAAGLSRDEAITKSITDVATSLGTTKEALLAQMGTSEQNLRSELAAGLQATQQQLTEQMQAQYSSLSAAQKAEVDARVQQGQDLQAAIQGVSEQTQQQIAQSETALRQAIGQLGTNVQGQFDQMSAAQKAEVAARVQQGQDLSAAIQSVGTQAAEQIAQTETALRQAIGQLGTDVQGQFNAMDAAQKAEVAARVQQGQDLQTAIANVGTATAQQIAQSETALRDAIGQLGTNVQGQFDLMSSAQKAEVAARVQQGQDLQTAIQTVGTQTQEQIAASETAMRQALGQLGTDVQSQFDQMSQAQQTEVAARVQQGQDLQAAIQNVGQQASQQLSAAQTALQGQITTLGEDLQRQYNEMSEAQRDEVAQRVQMGQQIDTAITNVGLQVGEVEGKLTLNIEDLRKQIDAENARKAAADKAAAQRQAQQKTLELGQQSVATPGGAAEGPLPQAQFRGPLSTGEAKETEFKGPLEDFLKKVETTSYTASPGQAMQQTQQTAQSQQAQQPAQPGSNYYSYGVFNEIDQILNPLAGAMPSIFGAKEGGLATPMFAGGGLNVVHHAGKARMDFRQGAAVNGPGDGQSDDIPAMLADGEFVFPADVVSALGNGSTKAGSDKLYDMMHSIRSYHRSAKPQDLPPPAKKSPLDYLKKARR